MILVTGGAGYIGSHFVKFLRKQNQKVVVFDNFSRGHVEAVPKDVELDNVDILNYDALISAMSRYDIDAIVHFAAFAYVGESVENPLMYYENNVVGSFNLIQAAVERRVAKFIFSSTCSLYGNPDKVPISEDESVKPINPYAETKLTIEKMLRDVDAAHFLKYVALRYFNAAGADPEGEIGESHDPEPHLIPIIMQTALGKREKLFVFGNDYPTKDGAAIRDYIHVNDLADAHWRALKYLDDNKSDIFNLGTGAGYSVLEMIEAAEKVTGKKINYEITGRRAGDPAILVADNTKAKKVLGWQPQFGLEDIMRTAWNWHRNQKY